MANDLPDYMEGFESEDFDWGFTAVSEKPKEVTQPSATDTTLASDVSAIKALTNELMQRVGEQDALTAGVVDENVKARFRELERIVLPFLYNLGKSEEPYIHWPNRGPIIKAQMEKILKLTRG
ncbi:MAG: hypothetical protein QGH83_15450 [Candidatus Pacebacteria bacterium]|jgi:hypothetical protein|nr:hypothetical protein [Candidatus Paceibacterota bacterium]|tara:strand:+ start:947 stop:1315 length:369 start_codon:yes stop_codon:yes gene_type:complete